VDGISSADFGPTWSIVTGGYNASTDTSAPGGINSVRSATFTFVDADNGDYHISPSDTSGVIGGGTDLSAFFTTDFDGETRVAPWTIGADQTTYVPTVAGLRRFAAPGGGRIKAKGGQIKYITSG
jgi:hypothetical protein